MADKTYSLTFDGYWRETQISGIPSGSGVYCVYTCVYNQNKNTVTLIKLVYIGESGDVNKRISTHEKWSKWLSHLNQGEQLCFNYAHVDADNRDRVEAALIFKHEPPVNDEYVDRFPFDKTTIYTSGCNEFLHSSFTVIRKD